MKGFLWTPYIPVGGLSHHVPDPVLMHKQWWLSCNLKVLDHKKRNKNGTVDDNFDGNKRSMMNILRLATLGHNFRIHWQPR